MSTTDRTTSTTTPPTADNHRRANGTPTAAGARSSDGGRSSYVEQLSRAPALLSSERLASGAGIEAPARDLLLRLWKRTGPDPRATGEAAEALLAAPLTP